MGIASCQAIKTAAGRKIGPFRASIVALKDLPAEEHWKITKDDSDKDCSASGSESGSGSEEEEEEMDAD